jgi:hypothetical protein
MRAATPRETTRTRAGVRASRVATRRAGGRARERGRERRCRRDIGKSSSFSMTTRTTTTTTEPTRTRARRESDTSEESSSRAALEEKKRAFWETFWETLEEQRGKAPFMKTRRRVETTTTTTNVQGTTTETVHRESDVIPRSDTFWGRCTIGGLVLAVLMTLSASSLTHWPTARYVLCNPLVFIFDPSGPEAEAKFAIVAEIARRLVKPMVRYFAAWCALRSRWRLMWASFAASCVLPAVEFVV